MRAIKTLKEKRDMSLNEVKLTLAIEDPTTRDQKEYMGVEVSATSPSPCRTWRIHCRAADWAACATYRMRAARPGMR